MLRLADKSRCLSVVDLFIASWVRVSKRPFCVVVVNSIPPMLSN